MARLLILSHVQCGRLPLAEGALVNVPEEISQADAEEIVALGCGRWEEPAATDVPPKKKAQRKADDAAG